MCLSYREIRSVDVVVRKRHMCEWCAEGIEVKDNAHFRAYIFDGDFISGWMHPECYAACLTTEHDVICEGWTPGDFERGSRLEQ